MIISKVSYGGREIELCGSEVCVEGNTFTLLVGRNGCGKSTLFKKICLLNMTSIFSNESEHFDMMSLSRYLGAELNRGMDNDGSMTFHTAEEIGKIKVTHPKRDRDEFNGNPVLNAMWVEHFANEYSCVIESGMWNAVDFSEVPFLNKNPKLIAVSSSPFDKFPVLDGYLGGDGAGKYYVYRGAKANGRSSRDNYLAAKFDQLGSSFINLFLNKARKSEILPLFNYLGLKSKLKLILKTSTTFSFQDFLSDQGRGPVDAIRSGRFFKGVSGSHDEISVEVREKIVRSVRVLYENFFKFEGFDYAGNTDCELSLDISSDEVVEFLSEFAILAEYDLIDLKDIEFTKAESDSCFLLTDASSGELCILFNVLSIAGAISDDSVILLDEPELSLHPEWQCDFLPLVERIFSSYKRCHFIIATHSPQVVSSMDVSNSYIVNLEDDPAIAIKGGQASARSSDYQLAHIFRSPGHRNEYLITQIVQALSKIRDGEQADEVFLAEIEDLIKYYDLVPVNDPVKKLLSTLKKALRVIKND